MFPETTLLKILKKPDIENYLRLLSCLCIESERLGLLSWRTNNKHNDVEQPMIYITGIQSPNPTP